MTKVPFPELKLTAAIGVARFYSPDVHLFRRRNTNQRMANSSIPKSIRLNLAEWNVLSAIAYEQGTSRHRIMVLQFDRSSKIKTPKRPNLSCSGVLFVQPVSINQLKIQTYHGADF